jgi:hypothetical protein
LKGSTNSYTEGNVWSAGCKIHEAPYHAPVKGWVN